MAQVALNWVANRPSVSSVLIGATKVEQIRDNLGALDFDLTADQRRRLDEVSTPDLRFPYTVFAPEMAAMMTGGAHVGDEPAPFHRPVHLGVDRSERRRRHRCRLLRADEFELAVGRSG